MGQLVANKFDINKSGYGNATAWVVLDDIRKIMKRYSQRSSVEVESVLDRILD
jgi:hypothetical protein